MSAFVVDPKTINRILTFLEGRVLGDDTTQLGRFAQKELTKIEWGLTPSETICDLGQAMYNLNVNAVRQRYPDDEPHELPGSYGEDDKARLLPYEKETVRCSVHQAFMSLRCWLYQCSEGNVPGSSLFQTFAKIRDRMAYGIAIDHPAVEAAEWG